MANPDGTLEFNELLNRTKYNNTVTKANNAVASAADALLKTVNIAKTATVENDGHSNDKYAHGLYVLWNFFEMNRYSLERQYLSDRFQRANGAVGTAEVGGAWGANAGAPVVFSNRFQSSNTSSLTGESVYVSLGTTTTVQSDFVASAVSNSVGKTGAVDYVLRSGSGYSINVRATAVDISMYVQGPSIYRQYTYNRSPTGDEALWMMVVGSRVEVWLNGDFLFADDNVPSNLWNGNIFVLGAGGTSYCEKIAIMSAERRT
jgi:hypothetical protein